jgi:Trypsin-like peptidase domain
MHNVTVDPYSLCAVHLTMLRDDNILAIGSGVLWSLEIGLCVVTAWHNLTGAHFETRQSLSRTGARPNRVRVTLLDQQSDTTHQITINLRTDNDQPNWVVHPCGSAKVDLAAFRIPNDMSSGSINAAVNTLASASIAINVASDLSIVGFPLGLSRLGLPIWKRASLAIEPQAILDLDGHRYAIVDTATREGLSGAPVFARREGMALSEDGKLTYATNAATSFYGIYTGRLATNDPLGAQLGIVWPKRLVEELLNPGLIEDFV